MLARAVYPFGRFAGMAATGGIIAVPTSHPIIFIIIYGRGRGTPRPYNFRALRRAISQYTVLSNNKKARTVRLVLFCKRE